MTSPSLLIVAGCLLGLLQLAAGVAIGWSLRRGGGATRDVDLRRAHAFARELHGTTQTVGETVATHRRRFEAMHTRLQGEPAGGQGPTTELVVAVVAELLDANRQLQRELMDAERQIADQANAIESHLNSALTDALTGLPNRRALDDHLELVARQHERQAAPFSLLLLDLDHFKQINDTHGHPAGDEVLAGVAAALRIAVPPAGFVARYGGEEFAIVLPGAALDAARRAVEQARAGMAAAAAEIERLGFTLTASGGLAVIQSGETIASLLARADEALYQAKHHGRNCTYWHDGTACRLLEDPASPTAAADDSVPATSPRQSPQLLAACDELRVALEQTVTPATSDA